MAQQDSDHECCSGEFGRLVLAGLIGAVIGAAVGLLVAPRPGAELRSTIRERAGTAAEKAQVVQAKARDLVEAAKHRIEERRATPTAEQPTAETSPEA